ncbi:DUF2071 domain-containing protein [Haloarcula nitratireducens]|uniref:DUF2071 domain-containing protein n=1 Tax=Haloarcula nitratireducens TaxID=2487749 RepID=A0AAW4PKA2_9EURY|nr:DUF2071 domain-containing protein [Halomicroarcula nitratireducens]MBX0297642.1 DUF2071 domain-containing protein [Halomicroarcula nitratireducens]
MKQQENLLTDLNQRNQLSRESKTMLFDVQGTIDRRILVNYRIDPEVLAGELPAPFRPQTVQGYGIGGICLIRLRNLRPRGVPAVFGMSSENAAHRIAVEWDTDGDTRSGVYVARRDTDSQVNSMLGGTLFPGLFKPASFEVDESNDRFEVAMTSEIDETQTAVTGKANGSLPEDSIFDSLQAVSAFMENGSMGYSPTEQEGEYDSMDLHIPDWEVQPFSVDAVKSSYFDDFPAGAAKFDNALLMRGAYHEWHEGEPITATAGA